jgi:hypothetical protein
LAGDGVGGFAGGAVGALAGGAVAARVTVPLYWAQPKAEVGVLWMTAVTSSLMSVATLTFRVPDATVF